MSAMSLQRGLICMCLAASPAAPAAGADGARFTLELNAVDPIADGGCRMTYLVRNDSGTELSQVAYELVLFDSGGIVSQILTVDFGAMPVGRTRVSRFVLPETDCADISRVLVNSAWTCTRADNGDPSDACLTALATQNRTPVEFGL